MNTVEEDQGDKSEEVHEDEDEDELHAWCLLEESENEQWQEVTSKNSKLKKKKKLDREPLLSVENNSCASPTKVIEVKDNWANIRATLDTGAAGHVMPAEMFPRVKADRTSTTKKFVASNGERTKDSGEKTIPFKSVEGVHGCMKFRSASVVKPLISMRKVEQTGNVVVLNEKNPHIPKKSRRHSHQAGCQQRSVHHEHVGVSR